VAAYRFLVLIRTNQLTRHFFTGTIIFALWKRVWKSWAPLRSKFFIWLALRAAVGQLTALQKEDFLIRLFAPYVIKLMKQYIIPWLLVFRKAGLDSYLSCVGLLPLAPKLEDSRFSSWWCKTIKGCSNRGTKRAEFTHHSGCLGGA
jgi:hypothetical protein